MIIHPPPDGTPSLPDAPPPAIPYDTSHISTTIRGENDTDVSVPVTSVTENVTGNIEVALAAPTSENPDAPSCSAASGSSGPSPNPVPAPSIVQNIRGLDPVRQERETNFANQKSIKKYFPCYKGKGKRAVPLPRLKKFLSRHSKAQFIRWWRDLTEAQQDAQKVQWKEQAANEKAREKEAKKRAMDAKKRATATRNAEKKAEAAAAAAERKRKREEEADEKKRQRDIRRNDRRKKRRQEKAREPVSGLLKNGRDAAKQSASAKAIKSNKERGAKTKPTEANHLTNENARRMMRSAPKAAMRAKAVITLDDKAENKKFFLEQTVLTFNAMASPPNVGGSKSSQVGATRKPTTNIEVVTTDPNGFSKKQQLLMYKAGLLNDVVEQVKKDLLKGTVPIIASTTLHVRKFTSPGQLANHYADIQSKRAKANDGGKTAGDIDKTLGNKAKRRKRRGWR